MHNQSKNTSKNGLLFTTDSILFKMEHYLNLLGGIAIFGALLLGVLHVSLRFFLNTQVSGYVDWMEQFMVVFGFLGLAYAQRTDGHIRMDIVVKKMKGRLLYGVECISTIFALTLMFVLTIGAYKHFERSFVRGDSTLDIEIQLWYAKILVVISFVFIFLRLLVQTIAFARLFFHPEAPPIGIPKRLSDDITSSETSD